MGFCAAKLWGVTCPSPETIDIVCAEPAAAIKEMARIPRNVFLDNCIVASSSLVIQIRQLGTGRGGEKTV